MRTSETIAAIAPAIVAAFGKIEGAAKSAKNEAFKRGNTVSTYATLADAINASRTILADNGLATIQGVGELVDDGNLRCILITTRLLHTSGEWLESCIQVPLGKVDAQGLGSATSYGRRYALMAMLNMAAVDDDGNAASEPHERPSQVTAGVRRLSSARAKEVGLDVKIKRAVEDCDSLLALSVLDTGFDKLTEEAPLSWLDSIRNQILLRAEELQDVATPAREMRQNARGDLEPVE